MLSVGRNPLVLAVVVVVLGPTLAGGALGVGQDASPSASPIASPDASPVASPAASPAASAGGEFTVTSVDIRFEPNALTIPANSDVRVALPNRGALPRSFVIDALGINVQQPSGATDLSTTINAAPGTYEYYCDVPGHKPAGMVGTLTVR